MNNVTGRTRVSGDYKEIICPECKSVIRVRHFSWSKLQCDTCSSIVPKLDWFIKDTPAAKLGRKGGSVKSEAKAKAARANAKKPRGRWATSIAYQYLSKCKKERFGTVLIAGKVNDSTPDKLMEIVMRENPYEQKYPVDTIWEIASRTRLI